MPSPSFHDWIHRRFPLIFLNEARSNCISRHRGLLTFSRLWFSLCIFWNDPRFVWTLRLIRKTLAIYSGYLANVVLNTFYWARWYFFVSASWTLTLTLSLDHEILLGILNITTFSKRQRPSRRNDPSSTVGNAHISATDHRIIDFDERLWALNAFAVHSFAARNQGIWIDRLMLNSPHSIA